MQQAAVPGFKLSRSKASVKVLTTLALLAVFLGLLSAALMTLAKTGLSARDVQKYYLGSGFAASGLDRELSADSPRSLSELAEVTHLHLIGGSMLLFFLSHLLSLCELKEGSRIFIYVFSFGSFMLTFTLPWLIVFVWPGFAWGFAPSIAGFLASLLVLIVFPLREMWVTPKNA